MWCDVEETLLGRRDEGVPCQCGNVCVSCHCGNVDGIGGVVRWGGDCFGILGRRDEGVPC